MWWGAHFNDSDDDTWVVDILCVAAIGDYVWEDLDGDGIQDGDEPGFPGVTVRLYDGLGGLLAVTNTDASGYYLFAGLDRGDYAVEFVAPTGYAFTLQDRGTDDEKDSDADPATGRTVTTTPEWGDTDLSWDAAAWLSRADPTPTGGATHRATPSRTYSASRTRGA